MTCQFKIQITTNLHPPEILQDTRFMFMNEVIHHKGVKRHFAMIFILLVHQLKLLK